MTREEVENKMVELAEEAWTLAREYTGREDIFVTLSRHTNGIGFADATIDFDADNKPYTITKLLDCTRYDDGTILHKKLISTEVQEDGKPL